MVQDFFGKTFLALSITAASTAASATVLQLDNAGLQVIQKNYQDSVTVNGAYQGQPGRNNEAIYIEDATFGRDLVIDAHIESAHSASVDLMTSDTGSNLIEGNLIHKGLISIEQGTALLLDTPTTIEGDLRNEGTLNAYGDPYQEESEDGTTYTTGAIALEYGYSANLEGDLINTESGRIIADGDQATALDIDNGQMGGALNNQGEIGSIGENSRAIAVHNSSLSAIENSGYVISDGRNSTALSLSLSTVNGDVTNHAEAGILAVGDGANAIFIQGGEIKGKLINHGIIAVEGRDAVAIDPTSFGEDGDFAKLGGIVNTGKIFGLGEESTALLLDGIDFTQAGHQLENSGAIEGQYSAIAIGNVNLANDAKALKIFNSGDIRAEHFAIEADEANVDVELDWQSGTIVGDLTGLRRVGVLGDVIFSGSATGSNGRHIDVKNGWVDVGSNSKNIAANLTFVQPHTYIAGNLSVAGNSSVSMLVAANTQADKAIVEVSGTAEFDKGSSIKLKAGTDDFKVDGKQYLLLKAGELDNQGLDVLSSSTLLKVDTFTTENNQVLAKVTLKNKDEIAEIIDGGGNGNQPTPGDLPGAGGDNGNLPNPGDLPGAGGDNGNLPNPGDLPGAGGDNGNQPNPGDQPGAGGDNGNQPNPGDSGNGSGNGGGYSNVAQAGANFSEVASALASSNPDDAVAQAFFAASEDAATLAQFAASLTPEVNGAASQAATSGQSLITNVTGSRTAGARGASSGDTFSQTGLWIQALHSDADQDLRDGVAGFAAKSKGFAIGADGKVSENLTLGLAYSFIDTDVKSDTGNSTQVDGHNITLYSGLERGNYFVDANLSFGANDNHSKRHIAGTTAKANYDSTVLAASLLGGYTHALNEQLLLEPRVAIRYANIDIDGYQEKGSSAALSIGSQRYEVAEVGAGLRVAGNLALGQGVLQPQVKLMAYHDLAADQAKSVSSFVLGGSSFVSHGAKPVRNSYEMGVGVDYLAGAFSAGVSYDLSTKADFDADTWTLKLRYDF